MKRFVMSGFFLSVLSLVTTPVAHSELHKQNQSDVPIKLSTELVVLDVEILDKKTGHAIGGLKRENFSVYEDSVKQEITHFSQDLLPLSIILLLDLSGTVQPIINEIKNGALQALQRLKPEDEVAIMAFAQRTQLIEDFSKDKQIIVSKIESINDTAKVGRVTFLNEGVYQAAKHLHKASNPSSRRVIIAITDNLTNQLPNHGHSQKQALYELFESGSTVCGIIVRSGLAKAERMLRYNPLFILTSKALSFGSIKAYADKTGGIVVGAKKEELNEKFVELMDRLRTRYTIGYVSSNTKLDGKFRRIKVKLSPTIVKQEGNLAVSTRQGYYARRSDNKNAEEK